VIWLRWVRLAARLRVEQVRATWRGRGTAGVHADIDAIVADSGAPPQLDPDVLDRASMEVEADETWRRLVDGFALSPEERQFLALLAAVHVDPRLGRVLGYLDDDPRPRPPTPAAAARLWGWQPGTLPAPSSSLVAWRIAVPVDEPDPWQPTTPWLVDSDVVAYLCGRAHWATYWVGVEHAAAAPTAGECLYPELLDELADAATALRDASRPVEVELSGRPGSGRRTLLLQLCARLGRAALVIHEPSLGARALRTARLLDAVPLWLADDALVDPRPGALTLVARETPASGAARAALRLAWSMPELPRTTRLRLWDELARTPAPAPVEEWTLTPAEVATAAAAVPAGPRAVSAVTRRRLGAVSNALMTAVRLPYEWEDLVVADSVRDQLNELETQVRLADAVLDGWGFRRLTPTSRGTTALFAGPSGTGKTMAAQVLARSLDLDLYRVDLAEVVNKYIGETEKRLAQVFDECERCNVMVLFDEADALFGRRTRVRDAHDRFANIEIDYLLQRMDSFDGLAILATNRKGDLDPAFVRRIRVIVDFLAPTPAQRLRLWELSLPADVTEGVDRDWLAETLTLTGAEIKSAALGAAFLARATGETIGHEHVLAAVRRELAKRGTVLRAELNGNSTSVVTR